MTVWLKINHWRETNHVQPRKKGHKQISLTANDHRHQCCSGRSSRDLGREEKYIGQILAEKGAALVRAFEVGSRTGMMGMMGNEAHLQTLLEETASQGDISYIFIRSFVDARA